MIDPKDGIDKDEAQELNTAAKAYGKYGALGIQMVLFMGLCVWGGTWLDEQTGWKFPAFTLLGVFIGIGGAIWFLMRQAKQK